MVRCPVCKQHEFEEDFDLCPVCDWQYDRVQYNDPDYWGGANKLSINDYKKEWQKKVLTFREREIPQAV